MKDEEIVRASLWLISELREKAEEVFNFEKISEKIKELDIEELIKGLNKSIEEDVLSISSELSTKLKDDKNWILMSKNFLKSLLYVEPYSKSIEEIINDVREVKAIEDIINLISILKNEFAIGIVAYLVVCVKGKLSIEVIRKGKKLQISEIKGEFIKDCNITSLLKSLFKIN